MKFQEMRAVVTGASGGIGGAIATDLAGRGAAVLLVGRDVASLQRCASSMPVSAAGHITVCAADLATAAGRERVADAARAFGANVLVNNAGRGEFALVEAQSDAALEQLFAINTLAPIQLTRALLPQLRAQPVAAILNVGSVFGSLGYPGFAAYSATKFALRGYSEALRRELADSNITVHYLAPRATRTGFNASAVERMNAELGVAMDAPATVAAAACAMLERGGLNAVIGWPERLFVRINSLLPRVVDGSLRKQLPVIRRYATEAAGGESP
jgi:short-subunit dehydrogenase